MLTTEQLDAIRKRRAEARAAYCEGCCAIDDIDALLADREELFKLARDLAKCAYDFRGERFRERTHRRAKRAGLL